jgi:hypothetical protein
MLIDQLTDRELKLSGLTAYSGASDNTITIPRVRDPLVVIAHEAGCGLSKSPDQVHVCVSCNKVGN